MERKGIVMSETLLSASNVLLFGRVVVDLKVCPEPEGMAHNPFVAKRGGDNRHVERQLLAGDAKFARIYGFSYEGTYYDLPTAAMFLVHGDGEKATEVPGNAGDVRKSGGIPSRAPGQPSLTGVSAAEFQFVDELRVWSYDQADYTIRMDVTSGMFEQVLLESFFSGNFGVSGAKVSGAKVAGAKVSGAKVSGAKVSGAKLSGGRLSGDASD